MPTRVRLTLLAVLAALTPSAATPAYAQKPALTQNVDEQGRVPFHQVRALNAYGSQPLDCINSPTQSECRVTFDAVPAGHRLVITYVSVAYYAVSPSLESTYFNLSAPVTTGGTGEIERNIVQFPSATPDSRGYCAWSQPTLLYVEAGFIPSIYAYNIRNGIIDYATFTIEGYLVAL
jgi:hypothetical protein